MLDKSKIKNIVQNLFEGKKELYGAAMGSKRKAEADRKVKTAQDKDLEEFAPGATEKSKAQILQILKDTHFKLSKIFDSEGTPHAVRKIDSDHRLTSHLGRAIEKLSSK